MKKNKIIALLCAVTMIVPCCITPISALSTENDKSEVIYDNLSYHDADLTIPSTKSKYGQNYSSSKPNVTVPASYDMRVSAPDVLPAVRDQNPYGMCWAFSAIESAETNLIKKGFATNNIDLSELQLAYFMYHQNTDPLGNYTGDYNYISNGDTLIDMGGNSFYTTYTLANWIGPATESTLPYSDASYAVGAEYSSSLASDMDFGHLQNAYWINMTTDPESVKAFVMTAGAVGMAYNEDHSSWNNDTNSYYQNTKSYTNHAVAIVGWDDNYSKNNFAASCQPANNGAWLIRNSWGTGAHDGGYFWLSYEDASIYDQTAFVFDMESSDNYDHNYQYDGTSSIGSFSIMDNPSMAMSNVFTSQNDEILEAVSFSNPKNTNVFYEINIYLNPVDPAKPTSGTLINSAYTSGTEVYAGYHTVELSSPVSLTKGDVFAVVINVTDTQSEDMYIPFDTTMNYGWIACNSVAQAGESFYSIDGGYSWKDMTSYKKNSNIRIKAFTNEVKLDSPSGLTAEVDSNKLVSLNWNDVVNADSYDIYAKSEIESDYSKIANVTASEYSYVPSYPNGTSVFYKIVSRNATSESAFSLGAGIRLPISKHLRGFDFEITDWTTICNAVDLTIGESQSTTVVFYNNNADDKTMAYYSEDTKIATISSTGVITAKGSGTTTVHAVARDCTDEYGRDKTIMVYVPKDIIVKNQNEMQSAHPYAGGIDERYIYRVEGATSITMTFSNDTNTIPGNDTIKIFDKNNRLIGTYSGSTLAGKTIKVDGDTFIVRLQTVSGTYYGFKVTNIITSGDLVNKDDLINAIQEYSSLKEDDYSTESWAAYQTALTNANTGLNDTTYTQEQIDALKVELDEAVAALKPYINLTGVSIIAEDAIEVNGNYFIIVPPETPFDQAGTQLSYTVTPADAMYTSTKWSNDMGWVGVDSNGYASPHWDFSSEDLITLALTDKKGNEYSADIMIYFLHYMAEKVVLSRSSVFMTSDSEGFTLNATVTDKKGNIADYSEVIWTSENESVATVENGVIIPTGLGTTVIRATSDNTGVYDECTVTVTDSTVEVTPAENTTTIVDAENKYIYGLNAGITSLDGYAVISDDTCTFRYKTGKLGFGTGTIAEIIKDGNVIDSYEIIIFGDVNGDGWYDGMDAAIVACLATGLMKQSQIGKAEYKAADCNHDDVIDDLDVALLKQAGILLEEIEQGNDESQTASSYAEYFSIIDQADISEEVYTPIEEPVTVNPLNIFFDFITTLFTKIFAKLFLVF